MQRSLRNNNSNLYCFPHTMLQHNCNCSARVLNPAEATPYCSPTRQPFSHDDPLQHRLRCHISDCIKCRCDSGYNMTFTSSPTASSASQTNLHECFECETGVQQHSHRCAEDDAAFSKRHDYTNMETHSHLQKRKRNPTNLSLSSSSNERSVDGIHNCECHCLDSCQYSHVCTLHCSRSTCSSPMEATTTLPPSGQLCSCICKPFNLTTNRSSNSIPTSSPTNSTSPHCSYLYHQHRRRCSCLSWSFALATFFQNLMSPLLSGSHFPLHDFLSDLFF